MSQPSGIDWLGGMSQVLKTYTSNDVRKEEKNERRAKDQNKLADQLPGQHARELNLNWKKGGDGLPAVAPKKSSVPGTDPSWLRRSLKRMKEESEEKGVCIETIAAQRYGSYDKFKEMLAEAEEKSGVPASRRSFQGNTRPARDRFMRPGDDGGSDRKRFRKPGDNSSSCRSGDRKYNSRGDDGESWRRQDPRRDSVRDSSKYREERRDSSRHKDERRDCRKSRDDRDQDKSYKLPGDDDQSWRKRKSPPQSNFSKKGQVVSEPDEKNKPSKISSASEQQSTIKDAPISSKPPVAASANNTNNDDDLSSALLTDKQKNKISAKLIKAEFMRNEETIKKLKLKLERCRKAEALALGSNASRKLKLAEDSNAKREDETVILTRTSRAGVAWPINSTGDDDAGGSQKKKKRKLNTFNKDGERERYFGDDDDYTLKDLVARERSGAAGDDHTVMLSRLSAKMFQKTDGDIYTLDDMFESNVADVSQRGEDDKRGYKKSMAATQKTIRKLEKCRRCYGNRECKQYLHVATGVHSYVSVPSYRPLADGHCHIVPMAHVSSAMTVDENVWAEIRKFMRSLVDMYRADGQDCIFLQYCAKVKNSPHFSIECIPVPQEEGTVAPMYFKKSLQDCEGRWATNKKVVDTRGTGVRGKIPAGFPYFAVDFGMDGGFAHVIENEAKFPEYFGREIVAGMLDLGPELWRKPHEEALGDQTKRTIAFEKKYKAFDLTGEIGQLS